MSTAAQEIIIDSFAGGGGASLGIAWATGRSPDIAINHDANALAMHETNHPSTRHVREDVWQADLRSLVDKRPVGLLWLSPDCKHFSRAKGSKPVDKSIRSLAWVAVRWASQVRPRVIVLENVREFEDWGPLRECEDGSQVPCRDRKGMTFRLFVNRLRGHGYKVEWRHLNAADYGAPTTRKRLFLVARRDDEPIVWPEPTHGDPAKIDDKPLFDRLKRWRTAAECIDWSLACPSIFDRKRPLAEKTQRRIALGVGRYVIDAAEPYIVPMYGGSVASSLNDPAPTCTTRSHHSLVTPFLSQYHHAKGNESRCSPVYEPANTLDTQNRFGLVAPSLIQTGYGERAGQSPRVLDLNEPLGTVVAGGAKHALAAAFIAKHYGGVVGRPASEPLGTVTTIGTQQQLAAACLARFNHGDKQWNSVEEPLGVVTSQGNKFGLVYAFLTKYFGTAVGQPADAPLGTVTGKHRFGVVKVQVEPGRVESAVAIDVAGVGPCVIADIGMRMLQPRELARAQGFPDTYELTGTKTNQVAKIGNSVCPHVAAAVVQANFVAQTVPC